MCLKLFYLTGQSQISNQIPLLWRECSEGSLVSINSTPIASGIVRQNIHLRQKHCKSGGTVLLAFSFKLSAGANYEGKRDIKKTKKPPFPEA